MPTNLRRLDSYKRYPEEAMLARTEDLWSDLRRRRSVRDFSPERPPREVVDTCLRIAASAPSGANRQPWHFVVVESVAVKKQIRIAAEKEEEAFYSHRAPQAWLDALAPLGTDSSKPFLEVAPYLIAIFAERHGWDSDGKVVKNYYVDESVGIATGMLITALHRAGLASLTHTPSPMGFLNELLERPKNEKPFLLLVVGYPAEDAQVPIIEKKTPRQGPHHRRRGK